MDGVARALYQRAARVRHPLRELGGDGDILRVQSARDDQRGHVERAERPVDGRHRSGPGGAQGAGERFRAIAQPLRPHAFQVRVPQRRLSGEERMRHPALDERFDAVLHQRLGRLPIRRPPLGALARILDTGGRADQDKPGSALRMGDGQRERDPPAHRIPAPDGPPDAERIEGRDQRVDLGRNRVRRVATGLGRPAVADEIGREHRAPRIAGRMPLLTKRPRERMPGTRVAGEAVEEDEGWGDRGSR